MNRRPFNPVSISLTINLDARQIVEAVCESMQSEAIDLICDIDLAFADSGFTEDLMRRLAKSLRGDYETHEWEAFITTLVEPQP